MGTGSLRQSGLSDSVLIFAPLKNPSPGRFGRAFCFADLLYQRSMLPPDPDSRFVEEFIASPNRGERKNGMRIDCLVLHYTGLREDALTEWCADPGGEALRWLCHPDAQVSSHYLVDIDGRIVQMVSEAQRAWHAGRGLWQGCADINSCSIGIEIVNTGHAGGLPPYPDAQIAAVIDLCKDIVARHAIAPQRVLAHSDIAPDRKADPGEHFPWDRLHRAGIGHWVDPEPAGDDIPLGEGDSGGDVADVQKRLSEYGYGIETHGQYDLATAQAMRAFQRHFRPQRVDGRADRSTRVTLQRLIHALPKA